MPLFTPRTFTGKKGNTPKQREASRFGGFSELWTCVDSRTAFAHTKSTRMHACVHKTTGALVGLVKSQTPLGGKGDDRPWCSCLWTPELSSLEAVPLPFSVISSFTSSFSSSYFKVNILGCSLGSCSLALQGPVFYSWTPLELHRFAEGEVVSIFS